MVIEEEVGAVIFSVFGFMIEIERICIVYFVSQFYQIFKDVFKRLVLVIAVHSVYRRNEQSFRKGFVSQHGIDAIEQLYIVYLFFQTVFNNILEYSSLCGVELVNENQCAVGDL